MCTSSTAVAARTAPSPAPGPAQSSTSIGRSRLPPAASVAASVAEPAAVAADERRQALFDGRHPARQPRLGGVEDHGHRGGTADRLTRPGGSGRPRPKWIAIMPPASTM